MMILVHQDLMLNFLRPTEDGLKCFTRRGSRFRKNPLHQAFLRISEAITAHPAYVPGTLGNAQNLIIAGNLSTSTNEDRYEETSLDRFFLPFYLILRTLLHTLYN